MDIVKTLTDPLLIAGVLGAGACFATIVTLDPIRFVFDISEADHLRYSRLILSGALASSRDGANPVRIRLSDETDWKRTGKVDFVDNAMTARSGTIRVRALVEMPDELRQHRHRIPQRAEDGRRTREGLVEQAVQQVLDGLGRVAHAVLGCLVNSR
jgi:hypothetical protein